MALESKGKHDSEGARGISSLKLVANYSGAQLEQPPTIIPILRSSSKHVPEHFNPVSSTPFDDFIPGGSQTMDSASRYMQECLQYEKCIFDERIKLLVHRMAILCYHSFRQRNDHPFLGLFVERVLTALTKKLLLNKFQLLFLQYVLEETKWKYDSEPVASCSMDFRPFAHVSEAEGPQRPARNLQAYLLFCGYYSKKSLSEGAAEGALGVFLKTISNNFREKYQEWTELSGVTRVRINPKILNTIFRRLNSFQVKERECFENYNLVVEEILEISPAYSGGDKEKKGRKRRKQDREEQLISGAQQLQQQRLIRSLLPDDSSPPDEIPLPSFAKKEMSYASNVDGLDPIAYYNKNE